jgi:hypothetical protein
MLPPSEYGYTERRGLGVFVSSMTQVCQLEVDFHVVYDCVRFVLTTGLPPWSAQPARQCEFISVYIFYTCFSIRKPGNGKNVGVCEFSRALDFIGLYDMENVA